MVKPAKDEAELERVVSDSLQDWIGHVDDIYPQTCKTLAAIRAAGWAVVPQTEQDGWIGDDPSYGDGYDTATQGAADVAREALALEVKP